MTPRSTPVKPLAKHVQTIIETTTGLDYEPGSLKRTARPLPCRRCGASTLAGVDDDRIAIDVYLDPQPLSPLGEAVARIGNEETWSVRARIFDRGREIDVRAAWDIRAHPAGSSNVDIHAAHRCGRKWPPACCMSSALPPRHHNTVRPIDPPF